MNKLFPIILACLLLISACSGKEQKTAPVIIDVPINELGEREIDFSICWDFYNADTGAERFMKKYPNIKINIKKFDNDYIKYTEQMATSLMAGTAPDVFDANNLDLIELSKSNYLTDLKPYIEADPDINEQEYFMSVFNGLELNGGLYAMPITFLFSMVGVNGNISAGLNSDFSSRQVISMKDIFNIYHQHKTEGIYSGQNYDVSTVFYYLSDSYIDFENKTCDFNNPEFIQLLTDIKSATHPEKQFGMSYSSTMIDDKEQSLSYMFLEIMGSNYQYFLFSDNENAFQNFIPLADEEGNIFLSALESYGITSNSSNKDVAWEFIKFMTTEEAKYGGFVSSMPINRKFFRNHKTEQAGDFGKYLKNATPASPMSEAEKTQLKEDTENYISYMENYIDNYPHTIMKFNNFEIAWEIMSDFQQGLITAEQAAAELQNKISLALME